MYIYIYVQCIYTLYINILLGILCVFFPGAVAVHSQKLAKHGRLKEHFEDFTNGEIPSGNATGQLKITTFNRQSIYKQLFFSIHNP